MALDGGTSAYAVARKDTIVIRILLVTDGELDLDGLSTLLEEQYALLP